MYIQSNGKISRVFERLLLVNLKCVYREIEIWLLSIIISQSNGIIQKFNNEMCFMKHNL